MTPAASKPNTFTDAQLDAAAYAITLLMHGLFEPNRHNDLESVKAAALRMSSPQFLQDIKEALRTIPVKDGLVFSTSYNLPLVDRLADNGINLRKVPGQLHLFTDGDIVVRFPNGSRDYDDFPITYPEQPEGPAADYQRSARRTDAVTEAVSRVLVTKQTPRFVEDANGPREIETDEWDDESDTAKCVKGDWALDDEAPQRTYELTVQKISRNRPVRELHSGYVTVEPAGTYFVVLNSKSGQNGISGAREIFKTAEELGSFIQGLNGQRTDPNEPFFQRHPEDAYKITKVEVLPSEKPAQPTPISSWKDRLLRFRG